MVGAVERIRIVRKIRHASRINSMVQICWEIPEKNRGVFKGWYGWKGRKLSLKKSGNCLSFLGNPSELVGIE